MKNKAKYFFYTKLVIINALIFLFGFGLYHLMNKAISMSDNVMLSVLVPLGLATIGLITLEISLIFKYLGKDKQND